MGQHPLKLEFDGAHDASLAARLDLPSGKIRAFALFAHCFTCSKDIAAARHVASALSQEGIAVLRFDFTGLGGSGGVDVVHDDRGPVPGELLRVGEPETAPGPGDDGDLAFE